MFETAPYAVLGENSEIEGLEVAQHVAGLLIVEILQAGAVLKDLRHGLFAVVGHGDAAT